MTTYNEIKRTTGNNKSYAAAALNTLTETCWWVASDASDIVYMRTQENDWVAIPAVYCDEGVEFTTVSGASVIMTVSDKTFNYIAIEAK